MFDKVKTPGDYLYCIGMNRAMNWKMVLELERNNLKDSPDYHRAISAWAAYDTAMCLFEELMEHLKEEALS